MSRRWLIGALLVGACGGGTAKPAVDSLDAPDAPAPEATLSQFNVPLDYDFTPLMAVVERSVPKTFGSLKEVRPMPSDKRKSYAYEVVRGPFTAFVVGSQIHLRSTLSYAARGYYKPLVGPTIQAGCGSGDDRPKLIVEVVTPITVDSTWHLRGNARLVKLEPATTTAADRCKVSVLRYDVTDQIVEAAKAALTKQLPGINKKIANVNLGIHASGWWATLNKPIRLREGVWLELNPERLRVGKIAGKARVLTIQAGVDAYPHIVTGHEPSLKDRPLPALGGAPGTSGFNIVVDGNIDYPTVSKTLTDVLHGKALSVKGHNVVLETIAAVGAPAGRMALAVSFSGDATGTLQLIGTPKYEAARGQILVPDLDYDLATDNSLVSVIAWAKSDTLRSLLRSKARIPVAPVLSRGKELLTSGLNRTVGANVSIVATVDSVSVLGLYVSRAGLLVRAGAVGHAQVKVMPIKKASPAP